MVSLTVLLWSVCAGLMRQQFIDLGGNLGCLNLNSLAIEMDVVAVQFGIARTAVLRSSIGMFRAVTISEAMALPAAIR